MKVKVVPPCRSKTHKPSRNESEFSGVMEVCGNNCSTCGFNPIVAKKRLEKGHFIHDAVTRITEFKQSSTLVEKSYYVGALTQLVFPKGISSDE